jgi:hypothetical protein
MSPRTYRPPAARQWCAAACLAASVALAGCGKKKAEATDGGAPEPAAALEGHLDVADADQLAGWAWDPARPEVRLKIDLVDGDTKLQTVPADVFREDLVRNKKGDGKYGFSVPTPAALKDGKPHTVKAVFAGTSTQLNGSPKKIAPKAH